MQHPTSAVPIFTLYGEESSWGTPDLLHCEPITERSQKYNWDIKPHQHTDLVQVLYLQRGEGSATLDDQTLALTPGSIVITPPLCIHSFHFTDTVEGYILSLASPLLKALRENLEKQVNVLVTAKCLQLNHTQQQGLLEHLFLSINEEYNANANGRDNLLHALVNALTILLNRLEHHDEDTENNAPTKGQQLYVRFNELTEQHFSEHLSIEHYAKLLGVTTTYLNTLCRRYAGQSALQAIHNRLILEAKRQLIYSAMTISQISDSLGFSEPAYFTRFFKRLTGQSPKVFRHSRGKEPEQ